MNKGYTSDIFALIKFVDTEHVSKVLSGNLKMGSVKKFIEEYKEEEGLRNDPNECLSDRYEANQDIEVMIQYEGQTIGNCYDELKTRLVDGQRSYLFCMSAITSKLFSQGDSWCFDSRVKKLGDKAIIVTNSREFLRRIEIAVRAEDFLQAYPDTGGQASSLVQYVDFDSKNGSIGPFVKSKEYDFQNEWRLALVDSRDEVKNYPDPRFLELDDLTDIAFAVDTDDLIQRGFKLEQL